MPQFHMPMGHESAEHQFLELDGFTRGYIEAMFFSSTEGKELENVTFADLAPETLNVITTDCSEFQTNNKLLLAEVIMLPLYDEIMAGHDFWFTRNHHGVGYWDRDLGEAGIALTDVCKIAWGETDLYLGDDGKLYLS